MSKTYLGEDKLSQAIYLLQPSRPVLVTSHNADGSINVAPFSWLVPVSANPPLVGLALLTHPRRQHTLDNIQREGTFVVNLPGLELAERMVRTSYRYPPGVNKFAQMDFQPEPSRAVAPPGIGECRAHLECRAQQFIPTGDHTLIIAAVLAARYESDLFDENLLLRLDRTAPVVHLRQRKGPTGQTHMFLEPAGIRTLEIPYASGGDPDASNGQAKNGTNQTS